MQNEHLEKFWSVVNGVDGEYMADPRRWKDGFIDSVHGRTAEHIDELRDDGWTIEPPDVIEYRMHFIASDNQPSSIPPRNWAVYKHVNNVRTDWVGDFNKRNHADRMQDVLNNDLYVDRQDNQ